MVSREVTILNETGVHERLAIGLIKKASTYKSEILVTKGKARMNAKSVLGLCCLGINKGDIIEIEASGEDEEKALEEIVTYLLEFTK